MNAHISINRYRVRDVTMERDPVADNVALEIDESSGDPHIATARIVAPPVVWQQVADQLATLGIVAREQVAL